MRLLSQDYTSPRAAPSASGEPKFGPHGSEPARTVPPLRRGIGGAARRAGARRRHPVSGVRTRGRHLPCLSSTGGAAWSRRPVGRLAVLEPGLPRLDFCVDTRLQITWLDQSSPSRCDPAAAPSPPSHPAAFEPGVPVSLPRHPRWRPAGPVAPALLAAPSCATACTCGRRSARPPCTTSMPGSFWLHWTPAAPSSRPPRRPQGDRRPRGARPPSAWPVTGRSAGSPPCP